jgi:hypothetical protein
MCSQQPEDKMKLFEITDAIRQLSSIEDPAELISKTAELNVIFHDKALQIGKLCKEQESDITALDNEIKRLSERKQVIQNKVASWKQYLFSEMTVCEMPKIEDETITLSIRKNQPSVEVPENFDIMVVSEQFRKQEWTLKKKDIIDNFKVTGEIPNGLNIINDKKHLEIR